MKVAMLQKTSRIGFLRDLKTSRHFDFWAVTAVCAYYYLVSQSVTLDDAFIYFRVVNNFIATGRPVFNAGDNNFITTSPLWTALLALTKICFPVLDLLLIAKIWWVGLLGVAAYLAYLAFLPSIGRWAAYLPLAFFLSRRINSMTGNEIALLYVAIFGVLWASVFEKHHFTGLFLGIGYLARGEFVLMALPVFLHLLIQGRRRQLPLKETASALLKIVVTMLPVMLLWHVYYLSAFHSFFPKTFGVKMLQGAHGGWVLFHEGIWANIKSLLMNRTYLLLFVIVGAVWQPYLFGFMALYTFCHSLAYALLKIPNYHWYYYDYDIFILLFVLFGLFRLYELATLTTVDTTKLVFLENNWLKLGFAVAVVAWVFPMQTELFHPKHISNVYENNNMDKRGNSYAEVSRRLLKELGQKDVILTNEVGIISYFLDGYEIRDVNGLASPDISRTTMNNWPYFVDLYQPKFIMGGARDGKKVYRYGGKTYLYTQYFTIQKDPRHREVTVFIKSPARQPEI